MAATGVATRGERSEQLATDKEGCNMAQRGQRVPGNALASKLRDVELKTRPGRSRGSAGATGATGPQGPQGPQGPALATQILTTGAGGVATWTFPQPLTAPPVVSATPVAAVPVIVTVTAVSATSVTVTAWTLAGAVRPATTVHVALS